VDIATVSAMDKTAFVAALGDVFEHSPWVAERAYERRPFATPGDLHAAMVDAVRAAPRERQTALLLAHPDLAGKDARARAMSSSSVSEQASAALDRLSPEEAARIAELNRAYRTRHGFPFIIAVRHYTKAGIFHEFERRIGSDTESEHAWALSQVYAITRMRIDARFAS
jgi:2-oxo-4-hydroxy-4-carboxy-5-ureidoimidazoline decarboxylase